jgi:hypothetical protein
MIVCEAGDHILRAPLQNGNCPPGHKKLSLEPEKDDQLCEFCPPSEEKPPPDPDEDALAALERRIRNLENAPYFEVVNKQEQPIFRVGPGGVRIFNKAGTAVAAFGTSEAGGYFTGRSATSPVFVSMGASDTTAGIRIVEEGLGRMELATRDGRSSLRFPSGDGLIAGIGESTSGPGVLLVGTRTGQVKAKLMVPDERGVVSVSKEDEGGGLSLLEAKIGGGLLDIAAGNDSVVRMGHVEHRYGIVLAGPVMGLPLVPKSGLPGSYFMGCAGGAPACVPAVP